MTTFGERLRKERESRDVSLRELADATKIGKRYLEALERNEFATLPGGVFAKGYIRNYAEHLGLDPEPLIEDYLRERRSRGEGDPTEDDRTAQDAAQAVLSHLAASHGVTPGRRLLTGWVVGAGLLVLVVAAVLTWVALAPSAPQPDRRVAAAPAPPQAERGGEATRPEAPAASPLRTVDTQPADEPRMDVPEEREVAETTAAAEPEPAPPARVPPAQAAREETLATPAAAEPAPARETPTEEPEVASHLSIADYGVGTGVVDRQLVGRGDSFPEGAAVWFWTRVLGGRRGDTLRHVWIREGRPQGTIELRVGASHWRTQSRWTMRPGSAGAWAVEARDAAGRVLARSEFTCVPAD